MLLAGSTRLLPFKVVFQINKRGESKIEIPLSFYQEYTKIATTVGKKEERLF